MVKKVTALSCALLLSTSMNMMAETETMSDKELRKEMREFSYMGSNKPGKNQMKDFVVVYQNQERSFAAAVKDFLTTKFGYIMLKLRAKEMDNLTRAQVNKEFKDDTLCFDTEETANGRVNIRVSHPIKKKEIFAKTEELASKLPVLAKLTQRKNKVR